MKRFLLLILVAVALGLLLAGCSSGLKELTGVNKGSEDAAGLSAAGLGGNSELERAIANHVQNLVDAKFFFTENRGKASAEEIAAYRAAIDKQIRYKLSLLSSVDDFIFVNKVDMEIKDEINFGELKREFAMGKVTMDEIREKYGAAFNRRGLERRFMKMLEDYEKEVSERGAKKYTSIPLGDHDSGPRYSPETSEGTINYYLSTNRKGDIMLNRSWYNWFVHAAVWRRDGDLGSGHDYDRVTISAWDANNQYNTGAGVAYEYRLLWASGSTGVHHVYGLRVGDPIQGGFIWAPAWKGVNAVNWAGGKVPSPYGACLRTNDWYFCCSSIVWWAWNEQGYDTDSTPYNNFVWPHNLYDDDNTDYRYNYYP